MVGATPDQQAELAALIRSQARDDRSRHVRRGGPQTGVDLDRLASPPKRYDAIILLEGLAPEWGLPVEPVCPTCQGRAGDRACLRCDQGAWDRPLRGRINGDAEKGPTTYAGHTDGLKGGVGG